MGLFSVKVALSSSCLVREQSDTAAPTREDKIPNFPGRGVLLTSGRWFFQMDFTSEFPKLTQQKVGGKQTNKQRERERKKRRINCQFRLTHFHACKNQVFLKQIVKTNGNRRHFGHSILGTVSSPFLPSKGVAVQEGICFSSLDTCQPQPFSGISLGTAQGKYFHEISSESKELPVGPCCLCVVADLL